MKRIKAGLYEHMGYTIKRYDDPSGYAHVRTPAHWRVLDASGKQVYKSTTLTDCKWYIEN